jgi:hypothetical protein
LQLIYLIVLAWLPGAVLFRLPWLDRDRRAALDADERLFWAIVLSLTVSHAVVLTLAAAHRYSFPRLIAIDLAIAGVAAAAARLRLRLGSPAGPLRLTALVPAGLVVLTAFRFFPTAEYINGGKDPGVYVNEGIQIAQTGSLAIHDADVAAVPPPFRDLFFPSYQRPDAEYYSSRFMGFFVQDPDAGAVMGQFPHFFPASIALGYGLDGLTGARRAVAVWGMLGVLAVYFAGARVVGRLAAAAAASLLALHVIEVWFARYPNSEVVLQALLFATLLANARAHVDGDRFFAPVAAVLLGSMLFVSPLYVVLAVAGLFASLVLGRFNGQRTQASFVLVFAVLAALAGWYLFGPMRAYVHQPAVFLRHLTWWQYALVSTAAAGGLIGAAVLAPRPAIAASVVTWTPALVTAAVWFLAVYALVLRQPGGRLAAHDAYALRHFTDFYLTLPGLLAALVGFALVARHIFWRDPGLFTTLVVFACVLFFKIRISPDHFWAARRFVPIILPGTLLLAAAAGLGATRGGRRGAGPVRMAIGLVFVGLLGWHYARAAEPVVRHVEYAGLIPRIEHLAAAVKDDELLVAESRDAQSDIHVLALPLAYIYARHVLVLNSARPPKPDFATFLAWAGTRYRRVLFIGGGGTDLLSHRYGVKPIASDRFQVPEYEAPFDAYPRVVRQKEFEYSLYEFTPPAPADGPWFDLDIGVGDDLHVVRFYAKETSAGRTFRWSRTTSYVSVTVVPPSSREVTITMSNGGRPPAAPPCDVTVSLHGQMLGTVRVGDGFSDYRFSIPPDLTARAAAFGDPVELKLVTPIWNPGKLLHTADDRDLGVMVDRVTVK